MRVCTCFLLFEIFEIINSVSQLQLLAAAEPVTEETKNVNDDNSKTKNTDKNQTLKLHFRALKVDSFSDLIQEIVDILNIFDDTAFEEFFYILDTEIRNYHYKGCKFSEITENRDTRRLLTRVLKTIRWKPATTTKANINELADMLRDEKYDNSVKDLLNYLNSFYKHSKKKFHRFLNNLNHYRNSKSVKTHNDLVQVIRNGVRNILFNHYTELDTNTRKEIIERIETFWKKFKQIPNSNTDPVPEALVKSFEVSENETYELKEPELHFKQDSKTKLKKKRHKTDIKEADDDHSKDKEVEDDLSSDESLNQAADFSAEDLSSGQSFDSSSNSIKLSQERHQEYNTQRYMTLYTEEIAYKARTTKETEIMPMKNEIIRKHKDGRRSSTTPRYRARDVMKKPVLRTNQEIDDNDQHVEPNLRNATHVPRARPLSVEQREPRSKSKHENVHIFSQYDAVIDVRLDNPKLLESLTMFAPDEIAKTHKKPSYPRPAVRRRAKSVIKPKKLTAPTKKPIRHSMRFGSHHVKRVNESMKKISPSPLTNRKVIQKHGKITNKNTLTRRSSNDTNNFNDYVIKRIDRLEDDLKELKQMHNVSKLHENKTDESEVRNVTAQRKDMKDVVVEILMKTHEDLDDKDDIKENYTEHHTNSNETNTEASSSKNNTTTTTNMMINDTVTATVIENEITTQSTENKTNTTNDTAEPTTDTVASTDTTTGVSEKTVKNEDTTPTTEVSKRTMPYSQPAYYDYPDRRIDPFDHFNDGLDLNM